MPAADTTPPPPSAPPPTQRNTTSQPVATEAPGLTMPPKDCGGYGIVINAVEGWGKTTIGAFADNSVIIMAKGERGYRTLFSRGKVPARPQVVVETWPQLLSQVEAIAKQPNDIKMVVLDALSGLERLCHEFVCETQYRGDWGEHGFLSYQQGPDVAVGEWLKLLNRLDDVKDAGLNVLLLSHSKVKNYKNPSGPDYDRFIVDCHDKTWGVTNKWADCVWFGNFFATVQTEGNAKKGKAIGRDQRVLYAEHNAVFMAKDKLGLPPEGITMPNKAEDMWPALRPYIIKNGDPNV